MNTQQINTHICHEVVISRGRPSVSRDEILSVSRELGQWAEQQPGFLRRTLFEAGDGVWIDHVEWRSEEEARQAAAKFEESPCASKIEPLLDLQSMQMYHAREVPL